MESGMGRGPDEGGKGFWRGMIRQANRLEAGFAPEPGHLAFGVAAGGLLDGGDGVGEGDFATEVGLDFADADGFQQGAGDGFGVLDFGDGAGVDHEMDAVVDALMEDIAGPGEAEAVDVGLGAGGGGAEGGLGLAGEEADFEGAFDVAGVSQGDVFG